MLDGIEKLRPDVLSSLQSLMTDREISLPDGRRALKTNQHAGDLHPDKAITVHPSFRTIALASVKKNSNDNWMAPDVMSMFSTIPLDEPTDECLRTMLKAVNPDCRDSAIASLLSLRAALTDSVAEDCGVLPLSTRNMIRAARRLGRDNDLHRIISSIMLAELLPPTQRATHLPDSRQ